MQSKAVLTTRLLISLLLGLNLLAPTLRGQDAPPPAPARQEDTEEVVRISTELVQTDVTVLDKQGRFVDDLKPEQFELRVDGRPQTISFFERVKAGTINEDAQLAAARGGGTRASRADASSTSGVVQPLDRGRTIFFFIDDLHLSAASALRTRKTLLDFINKEMKQNDEAGITTSSGQLGFLQQLTSDKTVLRTAISRLNPRASQVRDTQSPPMSVVQGKAIEDNDSQVIDYFVEQTIREFPMLRPDAALNMVQMRARQLMQQSNNYVTGTLGTLENIVRSSSVLPGRKVVFFLSDGFILDVRNSDVRDRLRRITDAAARAGVVLYSMDARGLVTGMPDASDRVAFDPGGQLAQVNAGEITALQEPLRTLAADTGGRALLNTNALNLAFTRALQETSVYYLLAWRPETEEGRGGNAKFRRIEVSVKGRPELSVIVRRGFYSTPPPDTAERSKDKDKDKKNNAPVAKTTETELIEAMKSLYPRNALPTSLSLGYVNTPTDGMVLTASIDLDSEALSFTSGKDQKTAVADIAGAVFDDHGKIINTSRQQLNITPASMELARGQRRIIYSFQYRLTPGLYQVRVGARDKVSGRIGSAMQWIEIPDPKKAGLMLSSLFIGERTPPTATANGQNGAEQAAKSASPDPLMQGVMLSADRRFSRASFIRFVTYIYNATPAANTPPDVALQVQVFRDDQPVITTPLRKIQTTGVQDITRIPYAAEFPLASLPVGRYVLQVTAIDRTAKASASQRINFMIE